MMTVEPAPPLVGVSPAHFNLVMKRLAERLPGRQVSAFGSRVPGWPFGRGSKPYSDLDLAVSLPEASSSAHRAENLALDLALTELRADFEESELPWRVCRHPIVEPIRYIAK